jgi:NAD(P)H-dependent FMN reductase
MKILAISGSARRLSTNTALLRALQAIAPDGIVVEVYDGIGDLPVFSPDREGADLPPGVRQFQRVIADCDGLILSSPEYVRGIPGGLKNAIDWLVSGDQVVGKPIALVHASHRGDDMLAALRTVLSTISANFTESLFFRLPVMKETPEAILQRLIGDPVVAQKFLQDIAHFCREGANERLSQAPLS